MRSVIQDFSTEGENGDTHEPTGVFTLNEGQAKALGTAVGMGILIAIPVTIFIMIFAAVEPPKHLNQEEFILDALLDSGNK